MSSDKDMYPDFSRQDLHQYLPVQMPAVLCPTVANAKSLAFVTVRVLLCRFVSVIVCCIYLCKK